MKDLNIPHDSRVLILGPPAVGKSTLAHRLSRLGFTHFHLDPIIFDLCSQSRIEKGPLNDELIFMAVGRFLEGLGRRADQGPSIVELPYHDYLDLIGREMLDVSDYDCIVLLEASLPTLCQRDLDRDNQVPRIYIARCTGALEALSEWLSSSSTNWIRFDTELFTSDQVMDCLLAFLRRRSSERLSRLSVAPAPTRPYLGGHLTERVEWDPALVHELQGRYSIATALDVGCGTGLALDLFENCGIRAWGLEGNPGVLDGPSRSTHRIMLVDFNKSWVDWPAKVDLVWCTEVLEHVFPQFEDNVLRTIVCAAGKLVFVTAAPPGTPGYNHVNCRPNSYWVEKLRQLGLRYVEDTPRILEKLPNEGPFGRNSLKESGMLFEVVP